MTSYSLEDIIFLFDQELGDNLTSNLNRGETRFFYMDSDYAHVYQEYLGTGRQEGQGEDLMEVF